jgi:hypothetical protein
MRPSEFVKQFVGQKELPGNKFSSETVIGKILHAAGQQDGQAYCAYTAEAMCKECYPEKFEVLDKLFDASAVKTFKNFQNAAYPVGHMPQVDCLVVWQKYVNGVADWRGHCGIVTSVNGQRFESFEGNTGSGDPREGDGFYIKAHNAELGYSVNNGLRLLGFVQIAGSKV